MLQVPLKLVCKHKDLHASRTSPLLSGAQPRSQAQVSAELRLSLTWSHQLSFLRKPPPVSRRLAYCLEHFCLN